MCEPKSKTLPKTDMSRRHLLAFGAYAALTPWSMSIASATETKAPINAISPAASLKRLMDGNARYAANTPDQRDFSANRAKLAQSQYPIAAILSCADSRVAPELAFDQNAGDLFIMRVAGNVMSPDLLASLEYGVKFLGTPLVMVLGHTNCGAVSAAIDVITEDAVLPGHLPGLISAIKPAVIEAKKENSASLLSAAIAENVRRQVAEIKLSQPIVNRFYDDQKIDIVGAVYDLQTGKISLV